MALQASSKGKKRAREEPESHEASSSSQLLQVSEAPPTKKSKRAETRPCPVCDESIPLRLMAAHAALEFDRVEQIMRVIGSKEATDDGLEEGTTYRSRRSAVKARKSLSAMNHRSDLSDTLELSSKLLLNIKRHRKQRHVKLREMTKDEEVGGGRSTNRENVCPVCLRNVRGDQDVMEAHVDACLAHESIRTSELQEREEREQGDDIAVEEPPERVTDEASFRGTGFHMRDLSVQDVEDEVDVDGDDEEVFGDIQFTEGDLLSPTSDLSADPDPDGGVQVEGNGDTQREQKTLRDLLAEGKVVRRTLLPGDSAHEVKVKIEDVIGVHEADTMDLAIAAAKKQGDTKALITALENKVKQLESMRISSSISLLCRICLDPYSEPTVSTGCWHTCCRECWLRCLGSTQLCPICKRITAARELRRVYL